MSRTRPSVSLVVALTLLTGALAGCSDEPAESVATVSPPTIATSTPSPTATPTPTPSPTPTARPFELNEIPVPPEPRLPVELSIADDAGVLTFVKQIFTELSFMLSTGDTTEWKIISSSECKFCEARLPNQDGVPQRITGFDIIIENTELFRHPDGNPEWVVRVEYQEPAHQIWNLETKIVEQIPASGTKERYLIILHDGTWWRLMEGGTDRPTRMIGDE